MSTDQPHPPVPAASAVTAVKAAGTPAEHAVSSPPLHIKAEDVLEAINPSRRRRWLVMLCFPLFFALALPYWWYTTSIVRLPLPKERIAALENARAPRIWTQIGLTADDAAIPKPPEGKQQYTVEDALGILAGEVTKGIDGIIRRDDVGQRGERRWEIVSKQRESASGELLLSRRHGQAQPRDVSSHGADATGKALNTPLRVHLHVSEHANTSFPLQPYVQAGWGDADVPVGTAVVPIHPSLLGDKSLKTHYKIGVVNAIRYLMPYHLPPIANRALAYSPNITLSFVVVNEDAAEGSFVSGWDIDDALKDHILPHLETLAPVFNFSIESQVLYHAPLSFEPAQAEDGTWVVDEDGMKVFVSERWTLDSLSTNNPVLKFLVFVPSAKHRPLQLDAKGANSFLIPQFGSVVLLNPPASDAAEAYTLEADALDMAFSQFTTHLYELLSIPALSDQLQRCPEHVNGSSTGRTRAQRGLADPMTPWQLDTVLRVRLAENTKEAGTTLAGIVRLVDKISEMQLGESVRDKVLGAVRRLEGLPALAGTKSPLAAFILSRDAVGLANEAFFDPSMMGLLYFPDQHKFAIYTPLFAPIGVSVILGILREIVNVIRKRKAARKAKAAAAKGVADAKKTDAPAETTNDVAPDTASTTARETRLSARLRTQTS